MAPSEPRMPKHMFLKWHQSRKEGYLFSESVSCGWKMPGCLSETRIAKHFFLKGPCSVDPLQVPTVAPWSFFFGLIASAVWKHQL